MFASAVSAFQSKDWDALMLAIDPSLKFKNLYAKYEQIEVKDGSVFVGGDVVRSIVADRIIGFLRRWHRLLAYLQVYHPLAVKSKQTVQLMNCTRSLSISTCLSPSPARSCLQGGTQRFHRQAYRQIRQQCWKRA